jgi:hypothetical protein
MLEAAAPKLAAAAAEDENRRGPHLAVAAKSVIAATKTGETWIVSHG